MLITADGDCSHEIKRRLLLGRKVMTNLDRIFKSRDITLSTKVRLVKAMVFPMVMYGCESWTIRKAEHRRIDAFELWCWRRLLRVPWTARKSNRSILKEISPGCSLERMMLKLKLQYFGHLMWRVNSLEKTLMPGEIGGRRRRGRQRRRWLDGFTVSMDVGLGNSGRWWWTASPGMLQFMGRKESNTTERLNWTEHNVICRLLAFLLSHFSHVWLCDPMDCSLPGSSVHDSPGKNTRVDCHFLLQGLFPPRDQTHVSYVSSIGRWVLYH